MQLASWVSKHRLLAQQIIRFGFSGAVGVLIGYLLYEAVFRAMPDGSLRPTLSWLASYSIGIAAQHWLHRTIVFRDSVSYWSSLKRTYLVYGIGALVAATLNLVLNSMSVLDHRLVWLVTTGFVSAINFAALKLYAFAPDDSS